MLGEEWGEEEDEHGPRRISIFNGGRDADRLEFSVMLVPRGDTPTLDTIKQYADAGATRLVVAALASASGSGIEAVKSVAPVVERAQQ